MSSEGSNCSSVDPLRSPKDNDSRGLAVLSSTSLLITAYSVQVQACTCIERGSDWSTCLLSIGNSLGARLVESAQGISAQECRLN